MKIKISDMPIDPLRPDKHIDPETGIWPLCEWGSECTRGFVSDERFNRGSDKVIKRTNRSKTRSAYRRFGGAAGKPTTKWGILDTVRMQTKDEGEAE